jgi:hypothetical protein
MEHEICNNDLTKVIKLTLVLRRSTNLLEHLVNSLPPKVAKTLVEGPQEADGVSGRPFQDQLGHADKMISRHVQGSDALKDQSDIGERTAGKNIVV